MLPCAERTPPCHLLNLPPSDAPTNAVVSVAGSMRRTRSLLAGMPYIFPDAERTPPTHLVLLLPSEDPMSDIVPVDGSMRSTLLLPNGMQYMSPFLDKTPPIQLLRVVPGDDPTSAGALGYGRGSSGVARRAAVSVMRSAGAVGGSLVRAGRAIGAAPAGDGSSADAASEVLDPSCCSLSRGDDAIGAGALGYSPGSRGVRAGRRSA